MHCGTKLIVTSNIEWFFFQSTAVDDHDLEYVEHASNIGDDDGVDGDEVDQYGKDDHHGDDVSADS